MNNAQATDFDTIKEAGFYPNVTPSNIVQKILNPDALGIYVRVMSLGKSWQLQKQNIRSLFSMSDRRFRTAMKYLKDLGLACMQYFRDESGQIRGRRWKVSLLPVVQTDVEVPPPENATAPIESASHRNVADRPSATDVTLVKGKPLVKEKETLFLYIKELDELLSFYPRVDQNIDKVKYELQKLIENGMDGQEIIRLTKMDILEKQIDERFNQEMHLNLARYLREKRFNKKSPTSKPFFSKKKTNYRPKIDSPKQRPIEEELTEDFTAGFSGSVFDLKRSKPDDNNNSVDFSSIEGEYETIEDIDALACLDIDSGPEYPL